MAEMGNDEEIKIVRAKRSGINLMKNVKELRRESCRWWIEFD